MAVDRAPHWPRCPGTARLGRRPRRRAAPEPPGRGLVTEHSRRRIARRGRARAAVAAAYRRRPALRAAAATRSASGTSSPGIHADMGGGLDRYMVFNAGRFAAFCDWFGSAATFTRTCRRRRRSAWRAAAAGGPRARPRSRAPGGEPAPGAGLQLFAPLRSAAAVFRPRHDVHASTPAAADAPGSSSAAPPASSARTRCTSATCGADPRDLRQPRARSSPRGRGDGATTAPTRGERRRAFTDLRVYIVRDEDADDVRELVDARFGRTSRVEFAQADLCRRELLVEIEGVATLEPDRSRAASSAAVPPAGERLPSFRQRDAADATIAPSAVTSPSIL